MPWWGPWRCGAWPGPGSSPSPLVSRRSCRLRAALQLPLGYPLAACMFWVTAPRHCSLTRAVFREDMQTCIMFVVWCVCLLQRIPTMKLLGSSLASSLAWFTWSSAPAGWRWQRDWGSLPCRCVAGLTWLAGWLAAGHRVAFWCDCACHALPCCKHGHLPASQLCPELALSPFPRLHVAALLLPACSGRCRASFPPLLATASAEESRAPRVASMRTHPGRT